MRGAVALLLLSGICAFAAAQSEGTEDLGPSVFDVHGEGGGSLEKQMKEAEAALRASHQEFPSAPSDEEVAAEQEAAQESMEDELENLARSIAKTQHTADSETLEEATSKDADYEEDMVAALKEAAGLEEPEIEVDEQPAATGAAGKAKKRVSRELAALPLTGATGAAEEPAPKVEEPAPEPEPEAMNAGSVSGGDSTDDVIAHIEQMVADTTGEEMEVDEPTAATAATGAAEPEPAAATAAAGAAEPEREPTPEPELEATGATGAPEPAEEEEATGATGEPEAEPEPEAAAPTGPTGVHVPEEILDRLEWEAEQEAHSSVQATGAAFGDANAQSLRVVTMIREALEGKEGTPLYQLTSQLRDVSTELEKQLAIQTDVYRHAVASYEVHRHRLDAQAEALRVREEDALKCLHETSLRTHELNEAVERAANTPKPDTSMLDEHAEQLRSQIQELEAQRDAHLEHAHAAYEDLFRAHGLLSKAIGLVDAHRRAVQTGAGADALQASPHEGTAQVAQALLEIARAHQGARKHMLQAGVLRAGDNGADEVAIDHEESQDLFAHVHSLLGEMIGKFEAHHAEAKQSIETVKDMWESSIGEVRGQLGRILEERKAMKRAYEEVQQRATSAAEELPEVQERQEKCARDHAVVAADVEGVQGELRTLDTQLHRAEKAHHESVEHLTNEAAMSHQALNLIASAVARLPEAASRQ